MNKGYVILAQNTKDVDYIKCAEALAVSIRRTNQNANISLITDNITHNNLFDNVIPLPYGDQMPDSDWKLSNDWQVYEASPYEYTIKLEADMYIPYDLDMYFDIFKDRDIVVCNQIRNYKGTISDVRFYRKFIDDNELPDVYNAITYFKKSNTAETFFMIVRNVFTMWDNWKAIFKCNKDEVCTTDWAYSIACRILGIENTTHPHGFTMVHMKQMINDLYTDDWTNELVYEFNEPLRIQTIPQLYPLHYHVKDFAHKLYDAYH